MYYAFNFIRARIRRRNYLRRLITLLLSIFTKHHHWDICRSICGLLNSRRKFLMDQIPTSYTLLTSFLLHYLSVEFQISRLSSIFMNYHQWVICRPIQVLLESKRKFLLEDILTSYGQIFVIFPVGEIVDISSRVNFQEIPLVRYLWTSPGTTWIQEELTFKASSWSIMTQTGLLCWWGIGSSHSLTASYV
jgi:hypothetical protein